VKVDCGRGETALVIRHDMTLEIFLEVDAVVTTQHLLALGIKWSCENEEWKEKIIRKAKTKLLKLAEVETSTNLTHNEDHNTLDLIE
jgi:hypothetical protein